MKALSIHALAIRVRSADAFFRHPRFGHAYAIRAGLVFNAKMESMSAYRIHV